MKAPIITITILLVSCVSGATVSIDYLGNSSEVLAELEAEVLNEIGTDPTRLTSDSISDISGNWELRNETGAERTYIFDGNGEGEGFIPGGHLERIASEESGTLSFFFMYSPLPEYGHPEPFRSEEAYYAYWINGDSIFLMNSDSSLRYKMVRVP